MRSSSAGSPRAACQPTIDRISTGCRTLPHLDKRIRDAIDSRTQSDPIDLADIMFAVDFYERIVLDDEELIGGSVEADRSRPNC